MGRSVTLKDIARETGVDASTVSRALDPSAQSLLTSEVVERVRDAAERMGYRKNHLARGLRTNRTMTVGMVLPDITNTLFAPIVRGAESVLEPMGYASIIVNTDDDPDREETLVNVLLERGVDGIIDAAAHRSIPRIEAVRGQGVPIVTANRGIDRLSVPSVVNDDAVGIRLVLRHLHDWGHRLIAHVAGPVSRTTGQLRLESFWREASALGLDLPQEAAINSSRFDEDEGRRCTLELIDQGWPFTAIVCANDRLALGAIDALNRRGLSCPDDVSITGFNDLPFLSLIPPGLTTVRVQQFGVGRLSAEILVRMMTEPEAPIASTTVLPVTLVVRGSVAAPRVETSSGSGV
ncbi:MAG: LacI family DNA-binding transcriptional regulator [Rhodospirillaceae bacterium]|nr:LacI family DNA-binding transcriptional regulator [Rhodospirillaceae bacterium]